MTASPRRVRAATRGSALALWQTRHVGKLLGIELEEVVVKTSGESRYDLPISSLGGQGLFVKEVQETLLEGRADIAVHSAKDLPSGKTEGVTIAAVPQRGDPRDVLIGSSLEKLPLGAHVGTGAVRRRAQLAALRPDLQFGELRGNVDTRLKKAAQYDAIVLAAAGVERLGQQDRITEYLDVSVMVPQVSQGALAVECREDDSTTLELLSSIQDPDSRDAIDAERSFLEEMGAGCNLPVGAYASKSEGKLSMEGLLSTLDGKIVLRHQLVGDDPVLLGRAIARYLLDDAGGQELLDDLNSQKV